MGLGALLFPGGDESAAIASGGFYEACGGHVLLL